MIGRLLAALLRSWFWAKVRALETRLQYQNDRLAVETEYGIRADLIRARVFTKLKLERARDQYLALAEGQPC